jgi:hypothetical protein
MSPNACKRNLAALATLAMSTLAAGAASASPALDYGPEAEARFLEHCDPVAAADPMAAPAVASAARCRRLSEGLQERLGYAAFLATATGGPAAFDPAVVAQVEGATACVVAPPAVLLSARRRRRADRQQAHGRRTPRRRARPAGASRGSIHGIPGRWSNP